MVWYIEATSIYHLELMCSSKSAYTVSVVWSKCTWRGLGRQSIYDKIMQRKIYLLYFTNGPSNQFRRSQRSAHRRRTKIRIWAGKNRRAEVIKTVSLRGTSWQGESPSVIIQNGVSANASYSLQSLKILSVLLWPYNYHLPLNILHFSPFSVNELHRTHQITNEKEWYIRKAALR